MREIDISAENDSSFHRYLADEIYDSFNPISSLTFQGLLMFLLNSSTDMSYLQNQI